MCVLFVFVSQMTRNPPEANFPVAETLINNVPNVPQERLNLNSNWTLFARLAACIAASIFWTGSADVEGRPLLCPSFTLILQRSNCQTPCTTSHMYSHHITTIHWHQLTINFKSWKYFAHENEWQRALLLLSALPVQLPFWNYCCIFSRHLRCCLLLLSSAEYMN